MAQLYPVAARAEDASASETAAARALAVDGLKLAQNNDCAGALPKLERAEKLYHSPVVASRLGECLVTTGRLVEGTEVLRKVLREPTPAEPTPALLKALERAERVLDSAKPRIAGLTIKVAAVQDMSVKIDGNPVPNALVDTEIPTDPGEHNVDVSAPGFLKSSARVGVGEGEKKSITLTLARDPHAQAVPAPAQPAGSGAAQTSPGPRASESLATSSAPEPAPRPESAPNRTAAYVSLGIGTAVVAAGGVLGFMAMKQHKDLERQCPGNVCARDQQDALDSAKRLGNFSTIAFGVGGVGLALGTVLFFSAGSSIADHARATPARSFAGLSAPRLSLGPTRVDFGADF